MRYPHENTTKSIHVPGVDDLRETQRIVSEDRIQMHRIWFIGGLVSILRWRSDEMFRILWLEQERRWQCHTIT